MFYSLSTFESYLLTTPYRSFNHKTGEEDVHFTAELPHSESDSEADETDNSDATDEDEPSSKNSSSPEQSLEGENTDEEAKEQEEEEDSSVLQDDVSSLEMIMVKNVPAGAEVCIFYSSFNCSPKNHCHFALMLL